MVEEQLYERADKWTPSKFKSKNREAQVFVECWNVLSDSDRVMR